MPDLLSRIKDVAQLHKSADAITAKTRNIMDPVRALDENTSRVMHENDNQPNAAVEGSLRELVTALADQTSRGVSARLEGDGKLATQPGRRMSPLYDMMYAKSMIPGHPVTSNGLIGLMEALNRKYGSAFISALEEGEITKPKMSAQELFTNAMRGVLPKAGEKSGVEKAVEDLKADNERMKVKRNAN